MSKFLLRITTLLTAIIKSKPTWFVYILFIGKVHNSTRIVDNKWSFTYNVFLSEWLKFITIMKCWFTIEWKVHNFLHSLTKIFEGGIKTYQRKLIPKQLFKKNIFYKSFWLGEMHDLIYIYIHSLMQTVVCVYILYSILHLVNHWFFEILVERVWSFC